MAEWKPGDIAFRDHHTGPQIGLVVESGYCRREHTNGPHWHNSNGGWNYLADDKNNADITYRRAVVIDPELREQIEQLAKGHHAARSIASWEALHENTRAELLDEMQFALREYANPTPPKPPEPLQIGAVVVAADGYKYVRVALPYDGWAAGEQWQRIGGDVNSVRNFGWEQVSAVEVLSEGVRV